MGVFNNKLENRIWYKVTMPFNKKDQLELQDVCYQQELKRFQWHITPENKKEFEKLAMENAKRRVQERVCNSSSTRYIDLADYDDEIGIRKAIKSRDDFLQFIDYPQ
jgi:hypothetical protein